MKLIHISDIHLTAPGERMGGLNPHRRFAQALDDVRAQHSDATRIIITGDLTHWGEPAAYASLADALASGADAEPHRDTLEIIRSDRDDACANAWATISPVLTFLAEVGAGATVNMGEGIAPLTAPAAAAAIASRMPGGKELNRKAAKTADDAVSVLSDRFGG